MTSDEPARRPDITGDLETKRQFLADLRAQDPERRRRAMELISPHRPADATEAEPISYTDLGAALQDPGTLRAVQAKAGQLQAATEQRLRQVAEALAHRDTTAACIQAERPAAPAPGRSTPAGTAPVGASTGGRPARRMAQEPLWRGLGVGRYCSQKDHSHRGGIVHEDLDRPSRCRPRHHHGAPVAHQTRRPRCSRAPA